ncbi:ABC transporter, ATP-binding protein [hydrothermal vent metagenome]|uniref:ABC transporter, ATP-binding protein n=1 Tax=hydrothermal vent metagenome TaxID=652676 RepID=A0A3B1DA75_9ZZZZ
MSNFIQFKSISKWFESDSRKFCALENISFDIDQGEFIAIVGKSGSGKSTLLNMLTGIDHPTSGDVIIDKSTLSTLDETSLSKYRGENIGIVFQFFQLIPTLSVIENLIIAMDFVCKIEKTKREDRAKSLLKKVGILDHADKLPQALSGGEQQRAAIARALANNPSILVADEPTGNLDSKTTEIIQKLFREFSHEGKTVIIITHESVSLSNYDRIITLKDGFILSDIKKGDQ